MADVEVSVGANITPFKTAMAQVSAQAKQTGETLGLEIGSKGSYREEVRFERGIKSLTAGLANAKDPVQAFGAVLEGLGRSFRITGGALLAFAIGDFIREQLTKAAESATEFYTKTDAIFEVGKNSTKEFTESAVKSFEEAEKHYGEEGFLERIIYGKGQRDTIANGKAAVEQAKEQLRGLREAEYKTEAEKASQDPQVKMQGELDAINQEYDEKVKAAKKNSDDIANIEVARTEKLQEVYDKFYKDQREKLDKLKTDLIHAQDQKEGLEGLKATTREDQAKLPDLENVPVDTLKSEIALTEQQIQVQKDLNAEKAEQTRLDKEAAEAQKKGLENAEKMEELGGEQANKRIEAIYAKQKLNDALNDVGVFHGQASSLRKIGLGGTAVQNNSEQVKKLEELKQGLNKINESLNTLQYKLDSA